MTTMTTQFLHHADIAATYSQQRQVTIAAAAAGEGTTEGTAVQHTNITNHYNTSSTSYQEVTADSAASGEGTAERHAHLGSMVDEANHLVIVTAAADASTA